MTEDVGIRCLRDLLSRLTDSKLKQRHSDVQSRIESLTKALADEEIEYALILEEGKRRAQM